MVTGDGSLIEGLFIVQLWNQARSPPHRYIISVVFDKNVKHIILDAPEDAPATIREGAGDDDKSYSLGDAVVGLEHVRPLRSLHPNLPCSSAAGRPCGSHRKH